jgi:hypothetical protein
MNLLPSALIGTLVILGMALLALAGHRLSPMAAWLGVACATAASVLAVTVGAP